MCIRDSRHLVQDVFHVANFESDVIDDGALSAGRRIAFIDDHQDLRQRVPVAIRPHLVGGGAHDIHPEVPLDLRVLGEQMDVTVRYTGIGQGGRRERAILGEAERRERQSCSGDRKQSHFSQHTPKGIIFWNSNRDGGVCGRAETRRSRTEAKRGRRLHRHAE